MVVASCIKTPTRFLRKWPWSGIQLTYRFAAAWCSSTAIRASAANASRVLPHEIDSREQLRVAGIGCCHRPFRLWVGGAQDASGQSSGVRERRAPISTEAHMNRKLYMARAPGGKDPGGGDPAFYTRHCRRPTSSTGHGECRNFWRGYILNLKDRAWRPRWSSSTSASRPTTAAAIAGWHTRNATWRIPNGEIIRQGNRSGRWRGDLVRYLFARCERCSCGGLADWPRIPVARQHVGIMDGRRLDPCMHCADDPPMR